MITRNPSLTDQVKAHIKEQIVNDEFEDGRIPPEATLAEDLGVSRTTIRDALGKLEHEGAIYRKQGAGHLCQRAQGLQIKIPARGDLVVRAGARGPRLHAVCEDPHRRDPARERDTAEALGLATATRCSSSRSSSSRTTSRCADPQSHPGRLCSRTTTAATTISRSTSSSRSTATRALVLRLEIIPVAFDTDHRRRSSGVEARDRWAVLCRGRVRPGQRTGGACHLILP